MDNVLCPSQGNFRPCLLSSLFLDPLQSGLRAPQQPSGKPPASLRSTMPQCPISLGQAPSSTQAFGFLKFHAQAKEGASLGQKPAEGRAHPQRGPLSALAQQASPVSHKSLSPADPFKTTHRSFRGEDQGYTFSMGTFQAL